MSKLIDELAPMTSDLTAVADAIRANDRFLLVTHENPDGDALGSILAMKLGARRAREGQRDVRRRRDGVAARLRVHGARRPAPRAARTTRPTRVVLALDSATAPRTRIAAGGAGGRAARDRRRPPPRQHALRRDQPGRPRGLLDGEIVRDLLRELGVDLTPEIAEAIYIALVTDTGPLPVLEHDAEGHALAARAGAARRRAAGDLPPDLRGGAVRAPEAEGEGARPCAASTRTAG